MRESRNLQTHLVSPITTSSKCSRAFPPCASDHPPCIRSRIYIDDISAITLYTASHAVITPTRKASSMVSPGSSIAILIVGILALCAIVYWFFKVQVEKYVQALFRYRRKLARSREANTGENMESSESA
ncbi:hypothetical protein E4U21_003714 [Claviceps maximensis]|nr:hypothetical protein E4U21_003714 [Claviceps maximensis]